MKYTYEEALEAISWYRVNRTTYEHSSQPNWIVAFWTWIEEEPVSRFQSLQHILDAYEAAGGGY